jgi:glycosyltransferase involved in cell wall biosynthesis
MTVWIENPFDNLPREGSRPLRYWLMARAFVAAGHRVIYWSSDFSHTTKQPRKVPRSFTDEGIEVHLIPTLPYQKNVSFARIHSHRAYAQAWKKEALQIQAEKPDVLIISAPPLSTGPVARKLARQFSAKLVVDIMDAWPQTFERVLPKWIAPLLLARPRQIANELYSAADLVTGVAERYRTLTTNRFQCFYHGIELGPVVERSAQKVPRLVYIGNMGRTYQLEPILDALVKLPDVTLDLAGKGAQEEVLKEKCRALGLDGRVTFHGQLAQNEMNALLRSCDIGIVPMQGESCVGVPYKFADYAAAGCAILSSLEGESADLLSRYHAGLLYEANNADSFAMKVKELLPQLVTMQQGARRLAETEFDARQIYRDYVNTVTNL